MKTNTFNALGVIALISGSIFLQACTVGLDPKVGYEPDVIDEPAEEPAEEPAGEPSTEVTPEDCDDGIR